MSARETDTTAQPDSLTELIEEGLAAAGILPTHHRVDQLDKQLRVEMDRLLPVVQAQADRLNKGTPDWYLQQRVIDSARRTLQDGPGDGLRSAAMQVRELALQCAALARYADLPGDSQ
ncbi:DUF6415 family natural product biosynthesis protein [Streptomyces phaeochromogenes]|uniref:DUF6415 family natural product biosynthesis protein n=1 Tax=Streptomyces phaeochromogenes TaxID=1923 RepID=UPI0036773E12